MANLESERARHYELANRLEAPDCFRCGHPYEDHPETTTYHDDGSKSGPDTSCMADCDCPGYLTPDAEQGAEDAAIAKWERDHER